AVDRLVGDDGCGSGWGSRQLLVQLGQKRLAPFEVGAEAEERQGLGLAGCPSGLGKADTGGFVTQILQGTEILALVRALPELFTVVLLQLTQLWRFVRMWIEGALGIGQEDVDGFAERLGDVEL